MKQIGFFSYLKGREIGKKGAGHSPLADYNLSITVEEKVQFKKLKGAQEFHDFFISKLDFLGLKTTAKNNNGFLKLRNLPEKIPIVEIVRPLQINLLKFISFRFDMQNKTSSDAEFDANIKHWVVEFILRELKDEDVKVRFYDLVEAFALKRNKACIDILIEAMKMIMEETIAYSGAQRVYDALYSLIDLDLSTASIMYRIALIGIPQLEIDPDIKLAEICQAKILFTKSKESYLVALDVFEIILDNFINIFKHIEFNLRRIVNPLQALRDNFFKITNRLMEIGCMEAHQFLVTCFGDSAHLNFNPDKAKEIEKNKPTVIFNSNKLIKEWWLIVLYKAKLYDNDEAVAFLEKFTFAIPGLISQQIDQIKNTTSELKFERNNQSEFPETFLSRIYKAMLIYAKRNAVFASAAMNVYSENLNFQKLLLMTMVEEARPNVAKKGKKSRRKTFSKELILNPEPLDKCSKDPHFLNLYYYGHYLILEADEAAIKLGEKFFQVAYELTEVKHTLACHVLSSYDYKILSTTSEFSPLALNLALKWRLKLAEEKNEIVLFQLMHLFSNGELLAGTTANPLEIGQLNTLVNFNLADKWKAIMPTLSTCEPGEIKKLCEETVLFLQSVNVGALTTPLSVWAFSDKPSLSLEDILAFQAASEGEVEEDELYVSDEELEESTSFSPN